MILDEFLLIPTSDQEQRDLLELMEYRCGQASTILCRKVGTKDWAAVPSPIPSWIVSYHQHILCGLMETFLCAKENG